MMATCQAAPKFLSELSHGYATVPVPLGRSETRRQSRRFRCCPQNQGAAIVVAEDFEAQQRCFTTCGVHLHDMRYRRANQHSLPSGWFRRCRASFELAAS